MRWLLAILIITTTALMIGVNYIKQYPFKRYSQWIRGEGADSYYSLSHYRDIYLAPTGLEEIPPYQEDYVQLWKEFQVRNSLIPLPTRHPLFQTVPIIEMRNKTSIPHVGVVLLDPTGREISRVYTLPNGLYQDHSQGQELFKLPFFKKRIMNRSLEDLWKDIFSFKIEPKEKSLDEMIYDLYILHLRSKILPKETTRYGLIKDGKQAMIELTNPDKDYIVELVLTLDSGSIFSYVLKTERSKPESLKLRAKLLNSISFSPVDEAIGRLLYTEFKQLNFARQVDQEGMLYLFSAWTQAPENIGMLKEMIYYLERGRNTKRQLKSIYTYTFKRYGKTYTSRKDVDELDDPEITLQRLIEMEEKDNKKAMEAASIKPVVEPELAPDEKMDSYLNKVKTSAPKETDDMTVH